MALPGGWLLTSWGAPVARAQTLDALLAKAADHGLVQIEHRTARRTGESFVVPRLERGVVIIPAHGRAAQSTSPRRLSYDDQGY